jgi:hypothetical protein
MLQDTEPAFGLGELWPNREKSLAVVSRLPRRTREILELRDKTALLDLSRFCPRARY